MRENMGLYRGKLRKSDQWVKGNLLVWKNGNCSILINDLESNTKLPMEVDPETVGQFTGLYDKNNNKIFEGDIVLLPKLYTEKKGVVRFCGTAFRVRNIFSYQLAESVEIIGNIYDNPELLKEGA